MPSHLLIVFLSTSMVKIFMSQSTWMIISNIAICLPIFRRTLGSKSLGMNFISCIAVIYFLLSLKDPWISNCPVCSKVSVSILAAWPILFSTFFLFPSLRILHYPLQQASLTPLNLLVSSAGHLSTSSPYLQLKTIVFSIFNSEKHPCELTYFSPAAA